MRVALKKATENLDLDRVPIAAVLVKNGQVVGQASNGEKKNRLAHAEKLVIEDLISKGELYFYDYTLYVTVEPCFMCAGIIQWARVGRVVYGVKDPKAGAMGSLYDVSKDKRLNHNPKVRSGVLGRESAELLKSFFKKKRSKPCKVEKLKSERDLCKIKITN